MLHALFLSLQRDEELVQGHLVAPNVVRRNFNEQGYVVQTLHDSTGTLSLCVEAAVIRIRLR